MGLRLFDSQQFLNFVPANHYIRNWENPTAGKCWHLTPPSTSMSHCPCGNSSFCSLVWLYGHHLLNVFKKSSSKVPVGLGSYWTAEQHFRVEPSSLSSCYGITFPDHAGTFASLRFQKFPWWLCVAPVTGNLFMGCEELLLSLWSLPTWAVWCLQQLPQEQCLLILHPA